MFRLNISFILFIFFTIIFSGCSSSNKNITIKEKQKIYSDIKDEITYYRSYGNETTNREFYKESIHAYNMVNFYESKQSYPLAYLNDLEKKSKKTAQESYKKALKFIEKDKFKALELLNKMASNIEVEDGVKRFQELKQDQEISKFLEEKEKALLSALNKYDATVKSIYEIHKNLQNLTQYNNYNSYALRARNLIKKEFSFLFKKVVSQYKIGNYKTAMNRFNLLHKVYLNNREITKYKNILNRNNIKRVDNTKVVKNQIQTSEAQISESYLQRALEAQKTEQIPEYINMGVKAYNNQELENAKSIFQRVLQLDANHKTALLYMKKIVERLKTLRAILPTSN